MAKVEIKVPAMGESISEAYIGNFIAPNGSQVDRDAEILELETDKVNQVLYAPQAGVVSYSVNEGDTVTIGQVIGHVDGDGTAAATPAPAAAEPEPAAAPAAEPEPAPAAAAPAPAAEAAAPAMAGSVSRGTADSFIQELSAPAAPAPAAAAPAAAPAASRPAVPAGERESRKRMPRIRQVIAERLVEAQHTTAMLTTFNEADMSAVMAMRGSYKDDFLKAHDVKLGFMSFFVKAVVSALKAVPSLNAYIDGQEIVHRHYYDVGIAVGTERGLVVPVLRDCDQLNFAGVESGINHYAKQAREGSISLDDLQGGGFTITNGGIYGSLLSTPILNPPQSGILGMHKIQKRPMAIGDEVVVRPMMYLALSYDHRIVDGKEAVTFLVHVKDAIEDPSRLLLEV